MIQERETEKLRKLLCITLTFITGALNVGSYHKVPQWTATDLYYILVYLLFIFRRHLTEILLIQNDCIYHCINCITMHTDINDYMISRAYNNDAPIRASYSTIHKECLEYSIVQFGQVALDL